LIRLRNRSLIPGLRCHEFRFSLMTFTALPKFGSSLSQ